MKTLKFPLLFSVTLILSSFSYIASAQQSISAPAAPRGVALEVTYFKGRILAYQRIGEWTWYELFQRPADWTPPPGELPVAAVKIYTRLEGETIKARVTVLRGRNHEKEDFLVEYPLSAEKKTVIRELSDVGVVPFEMQLVRAPASVPDPPTAVNKTKSLEVSFEPAQSTIPTFSLRVLNNSPKAVACFVYNTSIDGVRRMSGAPRNEAGEPVIKPGETFQRPLRYAMKVSPVSTGEVPPALPGLVVTISAVVFMDGTYEGDAIAAATYLAGNAGQKAQLRRFLDMVRSKEFKNSPAEIDAAIAAVTVNAVIEELAEKFPTLTAQEKAQLCDSVDFGKSVAVKLFRSGSGEPGAVLAERLQKRIDSLP